MAEQDHTKGRRVVVKFRPDIPLPYNDTITEYLKQQDGNAWGELVREFPGIKLEPYFSSIKLAVLRKFECLRPTYGDERFAFTSFFVFDNVAHLDRKKLASSIARWKIVETAYVEEGVAPPPSTVDPLNIHQNYQDDAPTGIGSRSFTADTGIAGKCAGIVDLERGWKLDHEDLIGAGIPPPIWGENRDEKSHGTSVLGVVVAEAGNLFGGKGIAPEARAAVVSILKPGTTSVAYIAEAILHATCSMLSGDVLLLEVQLPRAGALLPVEADLAIFHTIRAVSSLGIVVIEAAGNGTVDLDAYTDANGKYTLNRNHADFRDSGAILVGAAKSTDRSRDPNTNYGTRIDCFAWGDSIQTTDTDPLDSSTYTDKFGQTSGASAIVAGAALLIQSWRIREYGAPFSPLGVRERFADKTPGVNTPSLDPIKDLIGVMPDLNGVRRSIEDSFATSEFQDSLAEEIRETLFGPSDCTRARAKVKGDLLIGLAMTQLAKRAERGSTARRLAKTARQILKEAGKTLGQRK